MSKIIKLDDGQLIAEDPDTGEEMPIRMRDLDVNALEAGSVNVEEVVNTKDHATTDVSHSRYVGPDDPETLEEFDVQDGDVWVEVDE